MTTAKPLAGKLALVTGASRGIGRATANELAALGADVALVARTATSKPDTIGSLEEAVEQISAHGTDVRSFPADLADEAQVDGIVPRVTAEFGRPVDILVCSAAAMGPEMYLPFTDMSPDAWRSQVATNLTAPFVLMKDVVPSMIERGGGRVINISTLAHGGDLDPHSGDERFMPGKGGVGAAYVATKVGLNGMCAQLAYELRKQNVLVVAIHPGFTATENAQRIAKELNFDISLANPMSLPARAVAYLASCDDPMTYTGKPLDAEKLTKDLGL